MFIVLFTPSIFCFVLRCSVTAGVLCMCAWFVYVAVLF